MEKPRLKVTVEAKIRARNALKFNSKLAKSKKFGLTKEQARKEGINSGIERAKQLIKSDTISYDDAVSVCRFKRFFGMPQTPRVEGAIDLWGGKKFIILACEHIKKHKI